MLLPGSFWHSRGGPDKLHDQSRLCQSLPGCIVVEKRVPEFCAGFRVRGIHLAHYVWARFSDSQVEAVVDFPLSVA
eukprot:413664-Rhodomonas_salina.1